MDYGSAKRPTTRKNKTYLSTGTVVVGELVRLVYVVELDAKKTYVTTLEHELGDDSVESTSSVTEA
jgi:hypothetical protein